MFCLRLIPFSGKYLSEENENVDKAVLSFVKKKSSWMQLLSVFSSDVFKVNGCRWEKHRFQIHTSVLVRLLLYLLTAVDNESLTGIVISKCEDQS